MVEILYSCGIRVGRGEEEIIFWKLGNHEWFWRKESCPPGITVGFAETPSRHICRSIVGPWPSFKRVILSAEYHIRW
jgi:hypothetical protein